MFPYEFHRLGFAWQPDEECWRRHDAIEVREISGTCWRLSRQHTDGCRLITSRRADRQDRLAEMGARLEEAVRQMVLSDRQACTRPADADAR